MLVGYFLHFVADNLIQTRIAASRNGIVDQIWHCLSIALFLFRYPFFEVTPLFPNVSSSSSSLLSEMIYYLNDFGVLFIQEMGRNGIYNFFFIK